MKRTYMLFGMTFLFSLFLLAVYAWGAPYISFNSNRTGQTDIYIIDTNGKNLRNLINPPASGCCAAWAPDGRSFAFASELDIYIKTFNVAEVRRLTNPPEGGEHKLAWSPDGNWIAFISKRIGVRESHIYKIDINDKNLQRLTNQGGVFFPTWSPDGQSIAFRSSVNGRVGIYVMDADGKNIRQIIGQQHVGGAPSHPAWSPDGKQIAFLVANDGIGIYIMDTDGQNPGRVSPLGTWNYNPTWSLDGKWIAYDAYDGGANPLLNRNVGRHIFIVSVEGASHGKSHNTLGNIILPHGFPKVFSPFLQLWTPRRPSEVG